MRSAFRLVAVATGLAGSVLLTLSIPAHADAVGTEPVGSFDYTFHGASIKIPTGSFLTHYIGGSDRTITMERAGVDGIGPGLVGDGFCNWRIDFQYEDDSSKVYNVDRGPVSNTCDKYTFREVATRRTLPSYGRACALFFVNGTERARQCHFIVKRS